MKPANNGSTGHDLTSTFLDRAETRALRVGIGGPVGAGKTSMTEALCHALSDHVSMAVITNDIYTREDADFLVRAQALPEERIRGVETGGARIQRSARMPRSTLPQSKI